MPNSSIRYFSRRTISRRLDQLMTNIANHPQRDELVRLIKSQVADDLTWGRPRLN